MFTLLHVLNKYPTYRMESTRIIDGLEQAKNMFAYEVQEHFHFIEEQQFFQELIYDGIVSMDQPVQTVTNELFTFKYGIENNYIIARFEGRLNADHPKKLIDVRLKIK